MFKARPVVLWILLAPALILISPDITNSQDSPTPITTCKYCFKAKRYPVCCSYWVIEFGMGFHNSSLSSSGTSNVMFLSDVGYMKNVNEKTSMGGTVYFAVDDDRHRLGFRFRYRRWLNDNTSFELSPGLLLAGGYGGEFSAEQKFPGFITTAGLSYKSIVTGYVGLEVYRISSTSSFLSPVPGSETTSTETTIFTGFGLGQEAGIVGLGAFAGLVVLVAATWD